MCHCNAQIVRKCLRIIDRQEVLKSDFGLPIVKTDQVHKLPETSQYSLDSLTTCLGQLAGAALQDRGEIQMGQMLVAPLSGKCCISACNLRQVGEFSAQSLVISSSD